MIPEIKILLIAASPILELRGSIPIAISLYHLPVFSAISLSIIGNLVPVVFLLWLLEAIAKFLSKHFYPCNRFFAWLFERTRRNHQNKFEKWKEFALVILVAIPLPFTGAWTGSLCAFVFGIPFKKAFPLIAAGVLIAGLIVTLTTLGIIKATI
jgi:uncharacterized membrane protein